MEIIDQEIVDVITKFHDFLIVGNPINYGLRTLQWLIIKGLMLFVDTMQGVLDNVFKLRDFYNNAGLNKFLLEWRPVAFAIGGVALMYFFFRYTRNDNLPTKNLVDNILLGLGSILVMSTVMVSLTQITFDAAKAIYTSGNTTSASILKANMTDLLVFDEKNWESANLEESNHITEGNLQFIDITESITEKDSGLKSPLSKKFLNQKVKLTAQGEVEYVKMNKGWFKWDEHYYRYSWYPGRIMIKLLILGLVLFFTVFKMVKLIYELGYNRALGTLLAFSDLLEGTKIKKILVSTINILLTVVFIALNLKCYDLFVSALHNWNFDFMSELVIEVAIGMAVIDGPFIVQELTGIDAGLKSVGQNLAGMYAAAKGMGAVGEFAGGAAKTAGDAASTMAKTGGKAAGKGLEATAGAAGAAAGVADGLKAPSLEEEMGGSNDDTGFEDSSSLENEMGEQDASDDYGSNDEFNDAEPPADTGMDSDEGPTEDSSSGESSLEQEMGDSDSAPEDSSLGEDMDQDTGEQNSDSQADNSLPEEQNEALGEENAPPSLQDLQDTVNQAQENMEPEPLSQSSQALNNSDNMKPKDLTMPKNVNLPEEIKKNAMALKLRQDIQDSDRETRDRRTLGQATRDSVNSKIGDLGVKYSDAVDSSKTLKKSNRNYDVMKNTTSKATRGIKDFFNKD